MLTQAIATLAKLTLSQIDVELFDKGRHLRERLNVTSAACLEAARQMEEDLDELQLQTPVLRQDFVLILYQFRKEDVE